MSMALFLAVRVCLRISSRLQCGCDLVASCIPAEIRLEHGVSIGVQ
jgi:hypothetical protein